MENKSNNQKIHVLVRYRNRIVFDQDIKAISSTNASGRFDILPQHANFISLIQNALILHKLDGTSEIFNITNGVIKTKDNVVTCYIDLLPPGTPTPPINQTAV